MRTVLTRVPAAELAGELAEMRRWLDKNGIEPVKFTCNRYGNIVGVCLDFSKEWQAEAFRSRFDDEKGRRRHDELLLNDYRWVLDFPGNTPASGESGEMMARACWWRLTAEEVRAEADGFNSASAKATMRMVAETWDRLAEEFERRLARKQR
jgi:hypothetical protein